VAGRKRWRARQAVALEENCRCRNHGFPLQERHFRAFTRRKRGPQPVTVEDAGANILFIRIMRRVWMIVE
jgi:hypothetical protein